MQIMQVDLTAFAVPQNISVPHLSACVLDQISASAGIIQPAQGLRPSLVALQRPSIRGSAV